MEKRYFPNVNQLKFKQQGIDSQSDSADCEARLVCPRTQRRATGVSRFVHTAVSRAIHDAPPTIKQVRF
ncbi:hypothetical protein TREMEDRAFT_57613 [Tremella mesenterica DSM 1558]|uniref:uncharacterized protein n=1 Tax=Tremella mesenterica (strain ATCC 24925 / CBS 8224 / DSM 1558 / NBRC 9311 / NRRL Y-6157 / RJB 2259-6 / UBC 559-6) TaxID=578456 RepID=UPI0003F491AC|nr:uncharacterized protein TREMEDRAFT_57613 [Tremella mesenterica DSM 1558]EIW66882.1 hypothetical protein TREMEDRAFT_57613 [Tremella mesenterica DSM 1558]